MGNHPREDTVQEEHLFERECLREYFEDKTRDLLKKIAGTLQEIVMDAENQAKMGSHPNEDTVQKEHLFQREYFEDKAHDLLKEVTSSLREMMIDVGDQVKAEERETNWVRVKDFYGEYDEDPFEWIEAFNQAAIENNWANQRKIRIASRYLAGIAADWYHDNQDDLVSWDDPDNVRQSFVPAFLQYFTSPERSLEWHSEHRTLRQKEDEKVGWYAHQFRRLLKKVDPENALPSDYVVEMFMGGLLRGRVASLVYMTDPKTLDEAIATARRAESGVYYKKKSSPPNLNARNARRTSTRPNDGNQGSLGKMKTGSKNV